MRTLIILSTLALLSCGKTKDLGNANAISKKVELNSFVTIPHEEGKSVFHKKLLNAVVEENFPSSTPQTFKAYEELSDYKMDERDLRDYKEKENLLTKVVFAFSNRTEIFFLPANIPLGSIPQKLDLKAEKDRTFKLLKNDYIKTNVGSVVYFVSLNHEDLILNDQDHYVTKFEMKDKFTERTVMLDAQKKFEVEVGYNYFVQSLTPQIYKHKAPTRNSGCAESGTCGGCEYKRLIAGDFVKVEATSVSQLGLGIKVNGKLIENSDVVSSVAPSGAFNMVLKQAEYSLNGGSLEIIQLSAEGITASQSAYDLTNACINVPAETITRAAKADLSVTLKVWGRGEELRKIQL